MTTRSLVEPRPLAATAAGLRSGDLDLHQYIEDTCDRIEEAEPQIAALMPEPDRRGRLRREAEALLARLS